VCAQPYRVCTILHMRAVLVTETQFSSTESLALSNLFLLYGSLLYNYNLAALENWLAKLLVYFMHDGGEGWRRRGEGRMNQC